MDGQYEVALVQSVFEDVFTGPLATINIFPAFSNMDMYTFHMYANDGEEPEKIIQNLNTKFQQVFGNVSNFPKAVLNTNNNGIYFVLPDGWQIFIMNVDQNYLDPTEKNTEFKFISQKFYFPRHFHVCSNLVDEQFKTENLLANFCIGDINSDVVVYETKLPSYVKLKDNKITKIELEYLSKLNPYIVTGKITSTLHFRKINGF